MILPRTMYIDAAKNAGARRIRSDCIIYGPKDQSGDSWLEIARPIYPMNSTEERNQYQCFVLGSWEERLTETANNEWYEVPCSILYELECVKCCRACKEDNENDGSGERRIVVVKLEVCIGIIVRHVQVSCEDIFVRGKLIGLIERFLYLAIVKILSKRVCIFKSKGERDTDIDIILIAIILVLVNSTASLG